MKKFLFSLATLGLLTLTTACNDVHVAPAQLPQQITSFVQANFPGQAITYAEKDLEWFTYKYDIVLANGIAINFNTDNQWDKINAGAVGVPAHLVPAPVAGYVKANFPTVAIMQIDKESYGYEVELASGLELKLNHQGVLMEMDD